MKNRLIGLVALCAVAIVVTVTTLMGISNQGHTGNSHEPGTNSQLTRLIASASMITTIPVALYPRLADVPMDTVNNSSIHFVGGDCLVVQPRCTFGDKSSKKLVILFGDSHAWMWLPAVVPFLANHGYRLQILWMAACPVANVPVWYVKLDRSYPECSSWRSRTITLIKRESPRLVLISERTSELYSNSHTLVTDRQFESGLEHTISHIRSPETHVALIGDIPVHADRRSPPACLSLHPTSIQQCDTPLVNPDPRWRTHVLAEKRVAQFMGINDIDPTPWLCSRGACFVVVGNFATYWDWSHVTATYASYLSQVIGEQIGQLL